MIERIDTADRIDSALAADPIDPTEANDPMEPIDNTLPTEPIDRIELRLPMLRIDRSDFQDHRDVLLMPTTLSRRRRRSITKLGTELTHLRNTVGVVFVKICGITRASDATAAVDAGADAIGLNFVATSRRRVDLERARAILDVVPERVMTVGIFQDQTAHEIRAITNTLGLDAAQLHGRRSLGASTSVAAGVTTVIAVVAVGGPDIGDVEARATDIVMLDAAVPGGGVPFDWSAAGDLVMTHRVLLAGGLHADNVAEAIRTVRPWGVDVASGVEIEPGVKDPRAIQRFVSEARAAAALLPET